MPKSTPTPLQHGSVSAKKNVIYWFRNDLRLADNPGLYRACQIADKIVLVYCHSHTMAATTRWDVMRIGLHRLRFISAALADLRLQLAGAGSQLLEVHLPAQKCLPLLASELNIDAIYCEEIAAPDEQDEVNALRAAGLTVQTCWQSSLLEPTGLPFPIDALPNLFTQFRQVIEAAALQPSMPVGRPQQIPPLPDNFDQINQKWTGAAHQVDMAARDATMHHDHRSSFPYFLPEFCGGSTAASAHVQHYLRRNLPHTYKQTRNQLSGLDYSTKFSPWLACGAISARQIYWALKGFEADHGANESSYWIWFELLWRDYFRLLHLKYGPSLYRASGLTDLPAPEHHPDQFDGWCAASTGEPLIDAGMAELNTTGYLSNRMRQIVASYLVHELACDWRAGAAWFEAQLIDYDVYSNHGNWLYIAGRLTDPRNARRFNIQKQLHDHDRVGAYRRLWGQCA